MKKFIYLFVFLVLVFLFLTSCSEPEKIPMYFSSGEEKELEEYCKTEVSTDGLEGDTVQLASNKVTNASQEDLEGILGYDLREGLGFRERYTITIVCSASLTKGVIGLVDFYPLGTNGI